MCKIEGDGKTPIGIFKVGMILSIHSNIENFCGLKHKKITNNMYWVDDSKSMYYNQLVDISETKKDWNSAEHLIEYPIEYEYLIEIKINPNNIPIKGSAIFLHCANNKATEGCIAIDRDTIKEIIKTIDINTLIEITK